MNDTTSVYLGDLNANGQTTRADAKGVFVSATSSEKLLTIAVAGGVGGHNGVSAFGGVKMGEWRYRGKDIGVKC